MQPAVSNGRIVPARSPTPEQLHALEMALIELELMTLPEPDPWLTTPIELVEECE
jgi:hypothetical protein